MERILSEQNLVTGEKAGIESAGSMIEEYKAMTHQKMIKYRIFRFVFPITMMLIYSFIWFRTASTKTATLEVYMYIFNEVLISTSFYFLGRLNNKRKRNILTEYVQEYARVTTNKERTSGGIGVRRLLLFSEFVLTACATLFLVTNDIRGYFDCFFNAMVVLFLNFRTNKVTTGSYLSFKSKPKAMKNRV